MQFYLISTTTFLSPFEAAALTTVRMDLAILPCLPITLPMSSGATGLAICKDDATAAARVLADFAKNAPALELKGGVVEGTFYDAEGIQVIAKIPSRDALISKFLGSIQSPIANFARVIKQIAEQKEA